MDSENYYYFLGQSGEYVKFSLKEFCAFYLNIDNEWEYSNKYTDVLFHGTGTYFTKLDKFDDVYPFKKIEYIYFLTNAGIVLKFDKDYRECYRLCMDNFWHKDPSSSVEMDYGNIEGKIIDFNDIYEIGDIYIPDIHNYL